MKLNEGEKFIYHQYNVNLNDMDDEKKIKFLDKENEKLLGKVLDLSFSLKSVLIKMQEKNEAKPQQIFMHKNEEFKGKLKRFIHIIIVYL